VLAVGSPSSGVEGGVDTCVLVVSSPASEVEGVVVGCALAVVATMPTLLLSRHFVIGTGAMSRLMEVALQPQIVPSMMSVDV
jgi:hypothetical protein